MVGPVTPLDFYECASRRQRRLFRAGVDVLFSGALVVYFSWLFLAQDYPAGWWPAVAGALFFLSTARLIENVRRGSLVFRVGSEDLGLRSTNGTWQDLFWSTIRSFEIPEKRSRFFQPPAFVTINHPDRKRFSLKLPLQSLEPGISEDLITAIKLYKPNLLNPWQDQVRRT